MVNPLTQSSTSTRLPHPHDWRCETDGAAPVAPLPRPLSPLTTVEQPGQIAIQNPAEPAISEPTAAPAQSSFWKIFTSTFITIFLAEIGDKTQVSTLLMSAEFHKPWVVFLGAGTALVATTLIGVWVGQWLSSRLSPRTLDVAAGMMLALISASLVWDVLHP